MVRNFTQFYRTFWNKKPSLGRNTRPVPTERPFFFSKFSNLQNFNLRVSPLAFQSMRRCQIELLFLFSLSTKKAGFLFFFNNSKKKRRRGDKLNPQSNRFSSSGNDKLCLVSQKNGEKTKRATDSVPRSKTKRQKKTISIKKKVTKPMAKNSTFRVIK